MKFMLCPLILETKEKSKQGEMFFFFFSIKHIYKWQGIKIYKLHDDLLRANQYTQ